ncbi:TonB-dependent hemoglobin/transferrin/lactoferrin family receptor [Aestuariirhabdus sp. Z084]|uniref:TonB-dependent hemoglobin/transferrin/lactoferrin family receptor n=1 Tax=Aestuariirhabdus haliotis TaxID=2918751 RepID=UPI00201B38B6|nr:TonB-dependent hemoglobin/transferrin/lactoferrin family receptor [Aestuariirhabdus haliotis]MCL6417470.1 TonB-dependent hemoglobin/transferrin/lactoferrin family receptor [Aestuariirhabdus haliotis]MCL6421411.1 TonB-dependent hemoglobin/transferrin/lactoferrin family receptor [Aestuariirhabdus haliotis]
MPKTSSSIISGLGCLLLSHSLAAETEHSPSHSEQVTQFKKVTVNATRVEQDVKEVNRPIVVIDKENLEERQPNSTADAVSREANVSVSGGAVPGNQKINIRGLQGDKVLQVIDGARSNTNFAHRPSYFLDPELLQSIEVLKGPSSSLWGSGAIGGVVVQNTIDAQDLIKEGEEIGGFVKQGYQDNGDIFTTTAGFGATFGQVDALVAGTYRDSDAMEQGNGNSLYGTESLNRTLLTKLGFNIDSHQRLQAQYRYADLDGHPPTVGSADDALNVKDNLIDREVKDTHAALDYSHKGSSDYLNFDAKIYYNETENRENNTFGGNDKSDVETLGINLLNRFDFGATTALVGIDGYHDDIRTGRAVNASNPSGNRPNPPSKAESDTWGIFTTLTHDITSSVQAEVGLRYDDFSTESKDINTSSDESELSASAGIRWQATDWMRWSLRYDEAFRAPNSYELYIQGTHFNYGAPGWDNNFVANPDLKPEKAENIELGVNLEFDHLLADDRLSITATAFKNDVEDFIYLDVITEADFGPPPACNCITGTSTHKNARDAELWGFEVETDYQVGAFNAAINYGQTRGTHKTTLATGTTKDALPDIPANKWTADVNYGFWDIDTKLGARVLHASRQDRVPDTRETYEGYTLTDLYATWEPSGAMLDGVKVDFSIANLFDKNYQVAWSEVSEPGRSTKISLKYSF